MAEKEYQRLFFALWPDQGIRRQLLEYLPLLEGCRGRHVALENLHITLVFLGSVDGDTRLCLEQAADAIRLPSFTLHLDRLGFWRRSQVVWLGTESTPVPLNALAAVLKKAMIGCELEPDERAFQAHMTLMRKAHRHPLESSVEPLVWRVRDFALVRSETHSEGVHYEVLQRWGLV